MELIKRKMPLDYVMIDSSDYHIGASNCHWDALRAMVDRVKQGRRRKAKVFLKNVGDSIEAIKVDDKRFSVISADLEEGKSILDSQMDRTVELFSPVAEEILVWGQGNHEHKFINETHVGLKIAERLGVPYGGPSYKFIALDQKGNVLHKMFSTHGNGKLPKGAKDPIQREANRKAHLRRRLEETGHTDCIYMSMGHTHQGLVVLPTVENELMLTDDLESIHQRNRFKSPQNAPYIPADSRFYANIGSFLKLYAPPGSKRYGYAEMMMLSPSRLGWTEVTVQGGEVVHVEFVEA